MPHQWVDNLLPIKRLVFFANLTVGMHWRSRAASKPAAMLMPSPHAKQGYVVRIKNMDGMYCRFVIRLVTIDCRLLSELNQARV